MLNAKANLSFILAFSFVHAPPIQKMRKEGGDDGNRFHGRKLGVEAKNDSSGLLGNLVRFEVDYHLHVQLDALLDEILGIV